MWNKRFDFLAAAFVGALMVATGPSPAAVELALRPTGELPGAAPGPELPSDPLVRRIQAALAKAGFFRGTVNGRMTPGTEIAIRDYQKSKRIKRDGLVTKALADSLETGAKVTVLLQRLERARKVNIDAAKNALLANPATRDLVSGGNDETADPTRDTTPCFRSPTARCLLKEASESAKAIFKDEMRDWALGEILASQAKAGLAPEAMKTVARIKDPRLIMVALRDIAEAQAAAGRDEESLAAVDIIPDPMKRVEALTAIAGIHARRGQVDEVRKTVRRLIQGLEKLDDTPRKVAFLAKAAVILTRVGDDRAAGRNLDAAIRLARSPATIGDRGVALRHVASALAEMAEPAKAMDLLDEVGEASERTPVLISAANAHARAGDAAEALATAESIEAERYRAVVLSRIAQAQAKEGDAGGARKSLGKAVTAAKGIKLPFARAFADSRIVLALIDIGKISGDFSGAVKTAQGISDKQLRAHGLWSIAAEKRRGGNEAGAVRTEELAAKATLDLKSRVSRVWMFGDIALDHAARGETTAAWTAFGRALEVARDTQNAWGRARVLGRIASVLVDLTEGTALLPANEP